ncbi:hypothetical protein MML48_1g16811 [Holotrichia oblita]|uniref:Uncharacterized protein n=1 Tax=Holotrichia oblita TaxID=644536 RepID=A0ACB9TVE4_HOLOL|nr:hypothetical protein MML48_1g16811 [Holotrichia oblita]
MVQNEEVSTNFESSGSEYIPSSTCSSEDEIEYHQKHEKKRNRQRISKFIKANSKRTSIEHEIVTSKPQFTDDFQSKESNVLPLNTNFDDIRRPNNEEARFVSYSNYGPCPHCLGFMLKKHLWHHIKYGCTKAYNAKDAIPDNARHVIAESNAILCSVFGSEFTSDFTVNIVSKLRDDDVGKKCKEDNLILHFGAMQYEKYSNTQAELIRQSMRQLARLLITLQENRVAKLTLRDFFIPEQFDTVVQAVKMICVSHTLPGKRPEFGVPSLGLKLGHAIRKCISIERGIALRKGNLKKNKELLSFMNLMDMEWSTRISSAALSTLHQRKLNMPELLPLTSDLLTLAKYMDREILLLNTTIRYKCTQASWNNLAVLTLARIILFNKRRSGEASKLTIEQYKSRPQWKDQCTEELKSSLTSLERNLAEKLTIVEIVGKRGRKVALILTEETKTSIDLLLEHRCEISVHSENIYIFARGNNSLGHLRGHDCLRQLCTEAQLLHPEYITGTKLRKYIATVCQVFSLSETENDWLARHLGHDIRVHREFYRLHENAVELTKVSRLLIAVDQGEAAKFAGKPLQDITLNDLPTLEEEREDNSENEEDDVTNDCEGNNDCMTSQKNKSTNDKKILYPRTINLLINHFAEDNQRKSKSVCKRPWSSHEMSAVLTHFKTNIKIGALPGKKECEKCISENAVLKDRKWTDVKFCIKNHLTKIKKRKIST